MSSDDTCLALEGDMTVQCAAELKPVLLRALEMQGSPVCLDLSQVTEIDSAGVQLLFMLRDAARAQQREMRIRAASPAVQAVFDLLGLNGCFGRA